MIADGRVRPDPPRYGTTRYVAAQTVDTHRLGRGDFVDKAPESACVGSWPSVPR